VKTILLLVHDDEGQEARLQAALDLTRDVAGHLACLDVTLPPVYGGNRYGGLGASIMLADETEKERINRAEIRARLAQEDVAWSWADAVGDVARAVVEAATLADIIVLNPTLSDHGDPDMRNIVGSVLIDTGKPILAVPVAARGFRAGGRALIAWDGRQSAASTMRACVPLLALSSAVHIVTVGKAIRGTAAADAAVYLSRHNIHASARVLEDNGGGAEAVIEEEARLWRADYIVMGAYGHGRLRETFGGVTKRMLTHSVLPLILGH